MSSLIANLLSIRSARMRCFTTTRRKLGASMVHEPQSMFLHSNVVSVAVVAGSLASSALAYDFGRTAAPEEIKPWDIDVRPDGKGLPEGRGTVAHGKSVFAENCAACHGANGQDGIKERLVGGEGTL